MSDPNLLDDSPFYKIVKGKQFWGDIKAFLCLYKIIQALTEMAISKNEDCKSPLTKTSQTSVLGNMVGENALEENKKKNLHLTFVDLFRDYKAFIASHII